MRRCAVLAHAGRVGSDRAVLQGSHGLHRHVPGLQLRHRWLGLLEHLLSLLQLLGCRSGSVRLLLLLLLLQLPILLRELLLWLKMLRWLRVRVWVLRLQLGLLELMRWVLLGELLLLLPVLLLEMVRLLLDRRKLGRRRWRRHLLHLHVRLHHRPGCVLHARRNRLCHVVLLLGRRGADVRLDGLWGKLLRRAHRSQRSRGAVQRLVLHARRLLLATGSVHVLLLRLSPRVPLWLLLRLHRLRMWLHAMLLVLREMARHSAHLLHLLRLSVVHRHGLLHRRNNLLSEIAAARTTGPLHVHGRWLSYTKTSTASHGNASDQCHKCYDNS